MLFASQASGQILATGGVGKYKNNIYWLNFNNLNLAAGGRQQFDFTVSGIKITAVIDQISFSGKTVADARLIPYISGSWTGDRLNRLYNIGGIDKNNTLVNAIRVNNDGTNAQFVVSTYATIDGHPADIGLVFGNAEADASNEYTQGTTTGSNWKLLETFVDRTTNLFGIGRRLTFSNSDKTVQLQCDYNAALLYTQQSSSSSSNPLVINARIQSGGLTGMALGIIAYSEMGDAPATYGSPSHTLTPVLSGGDNPTPKVDNVVYIAAPPLGSSLITPGILAKPQTPRLGPVSGDFDPASFVLGINADADNKDNENDEDGIASFPRIDANTTNYSVTALVNNSSGSPASLVGWIDFNRDGTFEPSEGVSIPIPSTRDNKNIPVTLTWPNLSGLVSGQTYARFRISTSSGLTVSTPSSVINSGEVEDYTLFIQPVYDLGVIKTASPTNAVPGQALTYTVTLTNNGPSAVSPTEIINVTDNLPTGFISPAYTPSQGTYNSTNGNWSGLSIPSGQSATLTIAGAVSANVNAPLVNTVTVTNPPNITDLVPGNNTSTLTSNINRVVDLSVVKTSGAAVASQPLTYTITLKNNGPGSLFATDVVTLTDNLPAGFTASAYTVANGTYNSSTGNWTGLTLQPGQSSVLTITGTVSAAATGSLVNTVTLTPPAGTTDPALGNNESTVTTPIVRQADFGLTKTASLATVAAGAELTYTLTLKNSGPASLTAADVVQVTDNLPAGFTATAFTPASGTYNSTNGNWTGLTLATGQTTTLAIKGTLAANALPGVLTNTATVTSPVGITDPVLTNNTATNTVNTIRAIDLGVTKTALPATAVAGQALTYTITLTNNGSGSLLAGDIVNVKDNLPVDFLNPVYNAAAGTYASSTGNWTGLTLAAGQSVTLTISGTLAATASGPVSNTVTLTPPAGTTDPVPENNISTITTPVNREIDLNVTKTATPKPAVAGQPLTYVISLSNTGPGALLATDVVKITDNLPAGFTAQNYTVNAGSYTSSTGNWTGLTLTTGQTANLTITGTVAPTASGTLTNTVTVTPAAGTTDPTPNTSTDITAISRVIDYGITKTASPAIGIAGEDLTYVITLTNNGPATMAAADVLKLTDNLPAGFTASNYSAAAGTYNSSNGNWTGLTLANGESTTLTITGKIAANITGSLINTATVTAPADVTDPTPGNNTSTVTTNITSKPVLNIVKLGAAGLTAGNTATYNLTITNTGSSNATGASITDQVPADLTNVNWTTTAAGAATITSGTTGIGNNVAIQANIPAGAANTVSVVITGTVNPAAKGNISNTATVTPAEPTGTGSNSTVNSSITSTSGVTISKTGVSAATAGNEIVYQIELGNNGPSNATGTRITDVVPAALSNVSWSAQTTGAAVVTAGTTGTGNNVNVTADIPAGNNHKVSITVKGNIDPGYAGKITNTAVATPQEPGSTPINAQAVTNVQKLPVFSITKSGPATAIGGNAIVYTINVKNTGPSHSLNTLITDAVPAAITNVNWTASVTNGTAVINTGASGTGNAIAVQADFNSNSTVQVIVSGTIASGASGNLSNTATVTPAEPGTTPVTSPPVTTAVSSKSGLTISKTASNSTNSGSTLSYVITVGNNGPSDAVSAHIQDAIPASVLDPVWTSVVQGTAAVVSGGTGNGNLLDAVANLPAGGANKVIFTLTGRSNPAYSGSIINTASVTATEPDSPSPSSAATTIASRTPALSITKNGPASINAGETITYTLHVTNNSPSDAVGLAITDLVPAIVSNVSWTATTAGNAKLNGALSGTGNTINLTADLPAGNTNQITIVVTGKVAADFSGSLSNTATVTPAEAGTTPALATATTTVTRIPVLTIQKAGPAQLSAGQNITYTIAVKNSSQANAVAAVITDNIPAGILNASWTTSTSGTATVTAGATGTGNVLSVTGNIGGNSQDQILITISGTVDPAAGGNLSNSATVSPAEPGTVPQTSGPVITAITKTPSVALTKTGPATANAGETVTYVINAVNNGPSNATALAITDVIPPELTNVSWTAAGTGTSTVTPLLGTGNVSVTGNLNVGNNNSIRITVTGKLSPAQAVTTLNNTATATPAEPGIAPVQSNTVSTQIGNKNALTVSKSGPQTVSAGQNVVYNLLVANNGPGNAVNAAITDHIPTALTNVSWSATTTGAAVITTGAAGTGNDLTITGNVPAGAGNNINVVIKGSLSSSFTGTSLSNIATVTPAEPGNDPVNSNTVNTAVTKTSQLHVLKTGPANAVAGQQISYTIKVSNSGPSDVTGAAVQDNIPAAILNPVWTVATSGTAAASVSNGTGNVNLLASLKANGTDSLLITINGTLNPLFAGASINNIATVTPPAGDLNQVPVTSAISTLITRSANVRIVKSGPADASAGEPILYTLHLTNAGPSTATGVNITDVLSTSILNATWTATGNGGATINTTSGTGNVNLTADIPAGDAFVDVVIQGTVSPGLPNNSTIVNTANVTSTTVPDPETLISNTSTVSTNIGNKPTISVAKSGPATANIGDPITYRIIVRNTGSGNITNAQITDQIPEDVQVIDWSATATGSATITGPASGTTNELSTTADIATGMTNFVEIIINGTVIDKAHTEFTNTASVAAGDTETSSVTTSLNKSTDLSIEKQGPQTISAGENITYTIKVRNNGPVDVPSLIVADNVPADITITNWNAVTFGNASITGNASGTTNNISINGGINAGPDNYLLITVNGKIPSGSAPVSITNSATVTLDSPDLKDYNLANNTASIGTNIIQKPALQLTKSGPGEAIAGEQINYVIVVSNNGPSDATNVVINDVIPPALQNVSWTATTTGTATTPAASGNGSPSILATIPQGAENTVLLNISGTVNPDFEGSISNTAEATADANPTVTSPAVNTVVSKKTALNIRKSAPLSISAGLPVTYTIEVTNTGPSNATGAVITDAIPVILQNVSWTAAVQNNAVITAGATGTGNALSVTANIPGNINDKVIITVTGTIPSSATANLVNTATVTPAEPGNPPVTSVPVTTTLTKTPGLVLVKTAPASAASGEKINYSLTLTNAGPSDALNTSVTDAVPAVVQNVQWSATAASGAVINAGAAGTGNQVALNVDVPVGGTINVIITGDLNPTLNGNVVNTATATPSEPGIDPKTSTVTTAVKPVVNLSITKSGPAALQAGQEINYQIRVINSGPSTALNAAITDLVPADITQVQWTASTSGNALLTGAVSGSSNSIATNVNLPAGLGDALIINIKGLVNPVFNGSLTNTATVTAAEDPSNPKISVPLVTAVTRNPIVKIVKTGPATLISGSDISYLITVTNEGTSDAVNLAIADVIPATLTNINWKATASGNAKLTGPVSGNSQTIGLTAGLPAGNGNVIDIVVNGKVPAAYSGTIVNTATATPAETGVAVNSEVTTTVNRIPQLEITKSGPAKATAGTDVDYVITVVNTGLSDAAGTLITDAVPAELINVRWSATSNGTAAVTNGANGVNNHTVSVTADIPAGTANTITIRVSGTLPADAKGSIQNTAGINPIEPNSVSSQSPPVVTAIEAVTELSLTNTVDKALQQIGQPVTFTVQLKNNGPSNATGVNVTDLLPAGYKLTNQAVTSGSYDAVSGLWNIGNLANGGTETLTLEAILIVNGPFGTTAVVSGNETDPLLTNNTAKAAVEVVNSNPVANADSNTLLEDQTLTVAAANGLLANDTDADTDVLSISKFTIAGIAGDQAVGSAVLIPAYGTITINSDGSYVFVPAPDYYGPVPVITYAVTDGKSGTASGTLTLSVLPVNDAPSFVKGADLVLLPYAAAQTVPGWATAISAGPANESGQKPEFIVTNSDPALFTVQPAIAADGTLTFAPTSGATGTVTVTVIVKDDGGTANGGIDQSAAQTFTITLTPASPSLSLTKVADNTGTQAGDVINYTLVVTNTGDVTLSNVAVTDPGADAGSITPASIAAITPGANVTVKAKHTLTQADVDAGTFSNQAAVTGTDPAGNTVNKHKSDDPNTPDVDDATVITITPKLLITLVKTGAVSTDGNSINYTFVIQNPSNTTYKTVVLNDAKLGIANKSINVGAGLLPGASITVTEVYTLTQADKNAGNVTNTADVTATTPTGATATDISGTDATNNTSTVTPVSPLGGLSLVKTAKFSGNQITYTFTIKNLGNVTLNTVTLSDEKLGISNRIVDVNGGLVPGASVEVTEVYTLTQADKDAGSVTNTATAKAKTPAGTEVTAVSGNAEGNIAPTATTVPKSPVANDDKIEGKANSPIVIDILGNDNTGNSTFDKSSIVILTQPLHGKVIVNDDGTVTYTPEPGYSGPESFTYQVKDMYGYVTNIATVSLNINFFEINIPTLFTPNGDGRNDVFEIRGLNQYGENELTILNRWGNEVYKQKNYQNNWSGEGLNEGTYYYLLRVKPKGGNAEWQIFKGYTTLIRAFKK